MVPCAGNAGVRRGFAGERERETEKGKKEKGVATWRPKCQESTYCFGILLLLLLGIWSCIVSISFYSDGLNFSSKAHSTLCNITFTPVATKVLTISSVNMDA